MLGDGRNKAIDRDIALPAVAMLSELGVLSFVEVPDELCLRAG